MQRQQRCCWVFSSWHLLLLIFLWVPIEVGFQSRTLTFLKNCGWVEEFLLHSTSTYLLHLMCSSDCRSLMLLTLVWSSTSIKCWHYWSEFFCMLFSRITVPYIKYGITFNLLLLVLCSVRLPAVMLVQCELCICRWRNTWQHGVSSVILKMFFVLLYCFTIFGYLNADLDRQSLWLDSLCILNYTVSGKKTNQ